VQKILVIIPAHNEGECIAAVVAETRAALADADILVVNDASADATARQAAAAGAMVISLPFNLGIGGAVQTGYKFAAGEGYDIVARLDGDGQHDPAHLPALIAPVIKGESDVSIGSRFLQGSSYDSPLARSIGIKLFAAITSAIVGQRLTDTTSGFQVANREVVAFYAQEYPQDYPEVEGLVLLHRAGFRVCEVPTTFRRRRAGRSSITSARAFYYVFKVLLALLLNLMRKPIHKRTVDQ
jgi:glycosyltransferase involved in cell wall biosynthesis